MYKLAIMATPLFTLLMLFLVTKSSCAQVTTSIQTGLDDCKIKYLVAVTEEADGIGVSLLYQNVATDSMSVVLSQTHARLVINGRDFSAECGDKSFRCQDLFVESIFLNTTLTKHFVFLPLSDGLQLIEILDDGHSLRFGDKYILDTSLPAAYHCSPVASFSILRGYYLVCVDSVRHYISFSIITLNKTSLRHSTLSNPIVEFSAHKTEDMKTLSNFVYVELDHGTELIYFAVGNSMFSMSPLFYTLNDDLRSVGINCTHVKKLEYLGNKQLIAYCDYVYVHYNLLFDDWELQSWNDIDGVTFPCPNSNVHISVFKRAMYIQYNIQSHLGNINIPGTNFDNGVCFGTADKTFFAYNDISEGVFVVDFSTSSITHISSVPCDPTGCLPLISPQGSYLLVRESHQSDGNVILMDIDKNFSKVIFAEHIVPELITLINMTDRLCERNTSDIEIVSLDSRGILVGVLSASIVFVMMIVVVVVGVLGIRIHYGKILCVSSTLTRPIQVEPPDSSDGELSTTIRDETSEGKKKPTILAPNKLDDQDRVKPAEPSEPNQENELPTPQEFPSKTIVPDHDLNGSQVFSGTIDMRSVTNNTPLAIDMGSMINDNSPLTVDVELIPLIAVNAGCRGNDILSEMPKLDTALPPDDEEKWKTEEENDSGGSSISITATDTSPLLQ